VQTITLNVQDSVLDKVLYLLKNLSDVEIVDTLATNNASIDTRYPTISFEEAQQKVKKSIANISQNKGRDADSVFEELLS
jgi:hypothetical protein